MAKYTPISVQNQVVSKHEAFHAQARAVKEAHYTARKAILDNARLSPAAQNEDVAKLYEQTLDTVKGILESQRSFVRGIKTELETELRGNLPQDANSIMLRRDAADRARRIEDDKEALAVLNDAVNTGDETMAHAVGTKARNVGWVNAAEAWQAAYPATSGIAEALAWVEDYTTGAGYNVANSIAYAAPAQ